MPIYSTKIRNYYSASSLLSALILLSIIGLTLFLSKEKLFSIENISQNDYKIFLSEKLAILNLKKIDKEQECLIQKKETVSFKIQNLNYQFHCQFSSIFIKPKPTKEKFIFVENIKEWLDLENYPNNIYYIADLNEIPISSETDPKIIITTQPINGRLTRPFYGIVFTEYPFDFTDKRIYGTIYSAYQGNDPNRRNLSYKKAVIQNIERDNSAWHYLPNSIHIDQNENN